MFNWWLIGSIWLNYVWNIFPQISLLGREFDALFGLGDFWYLTIRCVGNHSGCGFNVDCGINGIKFESDKISLLGRDLKKHNLVWFLLNCVALIWFFGNIDLGD